MLGPEEVAGERAAGEVDDVDRGAVLGAELAEEGDGLALVGFGTGGEPVVVAT